MINHQGVLDAVTNMQQNAQAALPVIPNNGNPQGANNMAARGQGGALPQTAPAPQQKSEYFYSWMAPSPHMQALGARIGSYQPQMPAQPAVQTQPTPAAPVMPFFREPLR